MSLFLNLTSTLAMALLLAALALRAWGELLGRALPRRLALFPAPTERAARERPPLVQTAEDFLVPLLVLWVGTLLGYLLLRRADKSAADFLALWLERFSVAGDAPHYLYLAEHGYASEGVKLNLIVFYPLYPFLMGLLGRALGGSFALAGLLISQLGWGAANVLLARMARRDTENPAAALWAFRLYPFAFFALGIFTEGLFLFLSLGCLWALRRERFRAAGVWGFFTLLCRAQGIALIPVTLYAAWRAAKRDGFRPAMLWGLALPLGWGVYLGLNRVYCGDFFAFRVYESLPPWYQTTQWLGKTVAQQWSMARQYRFLGTIIYIPQLVLYYAAAGLLLAGLRRALRTEYAVYGAAYLGMCYLAGWLISGGRYMLGCAGMFLAVGQLRRGAAYAVLALEALACLWFYANFMGGQSIM